MEKSLHYGGGIYGGFFPHIFVYLAKTVASVLILISSPDKEKRLFGKKNTDKKISRTDKTEH